jgi:hypothetical protein
MDAFKIEFGKAMGQLIGEYRTTFAWMAAVWHVLTLVLLYLIVRCVVGATRLERPRHSAFLPVCSVW